MVTLQQVADVLGIDISQDSGKLEKRSGKFILRREYFWRPPAEPLAYFSNAISKLQACFGFESMEVIEAGDKWQSFKGGEGVKKNAHYFLIFKIKG